MKNKLLLISIVLCICACQSDPAVWEATPHGTESTSAVPVQPDSMLRHEGALGIIAAMIVVIVSLLYLNLQMQRKNRVLARQANKVDELENQLARRQRGRTQKGDEVTDEELESRLNDWLDADDHFLAKVTIQEAAAALHVTQKRISEMLEAMGKYRNLEDWATHKRVGRACTLILGHPEYTIESIAADAGFSSPRTFYRKFEAQTGLSPTEYRQAVAQKATDSHPSAEEEA